MRDSILLSCTILLLATAASEIATADMADLEAGIFIVHCPPGMEFSHDPPAEGWCQHYIDNFAISSSEDQVPRIDADSSGSVWYVLAAWGEPKEFCGVEFGFGDYDAGIYGFYDYGPCYPEGGAEIPTANWPGPNEGTGFISLRPNWSGNYLPVYHFTGYAYSEGVIPLNVDPPTGFGGFINCHTPPQAWDAACFGAMGILTAGTECHYIPPPPTYACCFDAECVLLREAECLDQGGEWLEGVESCDPNPCPPPHTYVVNPEGTGDFPTIQAAIDAAVDGDTIELTDGTFTGAGNAWFRYRGKAITVRSQGGNPEACIIDCQDDEGGVIFDEDEGPESVLEGITITNAWTSYTVIHCLRASPTIVNCIVSRNGSEGYWGAMLIDHSSPILTNCIFRRNLCVYDCGGLISQGSSSPTLIRCTFFRNGSLRGGPGAVLCSGGSATFDECRFSENESDWVGGVKCRYCQSVRFTNCLFRENAADSSAGGGLNCYLCDSVIVVDCSFTGNSATRSGGGFYCSMCPNVTLTGCTFSENWATERGGGMICGNHGYAALESCTFAENLASDGGGLFCSGSWPMLLENCIFAFSTQGSGVQCSGPETVPSLTCCNIFGNAGGDWVGYIADQYGVDGNISEDPLFCGDLNPLLPYLLHGDSPCAPDYNPECGLIGAWPVGCGAPQTIDEPATDCLRLSLADNFPNPFVCSTRIVYTIPTESNGLPVVLNIYDIAGRLVRTLVDGSQTAGGHNVYWDGTDYTGRRMEGGVYLYRLSVGGKTITRQTVLVR